MTDDKDYTYPYLNHCEDPEVYEVYGYRAKDLILFAKLCDEAGISPRDLKGFSKDVNYIVNLIGARMKQGLDNAMKEFRPEDMWRYKGM